MKLSCCFSLFSWRSSGGGAALTDLAAGRNSGSPLLPSDARVLPSKVRQSAVLTKFASHSKIGGGGFGDIYRCRLSQSRLHDGAQLISDVPVVIKVMRSWRAMEDEKAALLRLQAGDTQASALYIIRLVYPELSCGNQLVLEDLGDINLQQWLDFHRPVGVTDVNHLIGQILAGLVFCQERQVLHRDIKPENFMVIQRPCGDWLVKWIDFGLAVVDKECLMTSRGSVCGNYEFIDYAAFVRKKEGDIALQPSTDTFSVFMVFLVLLAKPNKQFYPFTGKEKEGREFKKVIDAMAQLCMQDATEGLQAVVQQRLTHVGILDHKQRALLARMLGPESERLPGVPVSSYDYASKAKAVFDAHCRV